MKKIFYFIIVSLVAVAFPSCNDKDDIRKEIDELNTRLDALQTEIDKINEQINAFYPMVEGSIYITSYIMDKNGDYVLRLSDGTSMTVYSGKPAENVPTVSINEEGYWCYILNGKEVILTDDEGNELYALPQNGEDGITPKVSVDENGYWVYSMDNGQTWLSMGGEVANPSDRPGSLFSEVKIDEDNCTATFILTAGGSPVTVPLYTDMKFEIEGGNAIEVMQNSTTTKNISVMDKVEDIVVEPTPLGVKVENSTITIDATGVDVGEYDVCLRLISKNNLAKLVLLEVTVKQ